MLGIELRTTGRATSTLQCVAISLAPVVLLPYEMDVKPQRHYILIKERTHSDDIVILNICAPQKRLLKFIRETLLQLKSHIDLDTLKSGIFQCLTLANRQVIVLNLKREMLDLTVL